jgi:hypothetical protein
MVGWMVRNNVMECVGYAAGSCDYYYDAPDRGEGARQLGTYVV